MIKWTMHSQQQQRGAQIQKQAQRGSGSGSAPREAVRGREGQDHEFADQDAAPGAQPEPGEYPASSLPNSRSDNTPTAPDPAEDAVDWDDVVQPPQTRQARDADDARRRAQAKGQRDAD